METASTWMGDHGKVIEIYMELIFAKRNSFLQYELVDLLLLELIVLAGTRCFSQ